MSHIAGVWAATVTPLRSDLSVDHDRFASHVAALLSDGCDGVVVFGTTGEAPSFTVSERIITLEALLTAGIPPDRIVVGTGCPSLGDTVALSRHASEHDTAGILVMPPYLFKSPASAGVVAWYRQLITDLAGLDVSLYLYHYPQLSGVPIDDTIVEELLAAFGSVIAGVKDSSGDPATLQRFLAYSDRLSVMPGTEHGLLDALAGGGAGIITAGANVNAAGIARAASTGDSTQMLRARGAVDNHGGIVALKAALARSDDDPMRLVRPPLVALSGERRYAAAVAIRKASAT